MVGLLVVSSKDNEPITRNQAYYTEQAYHTRNCQLGLSGWKLEECTAIENELLVWKQKCLTEREGVFSALTKLDGYSLSFSTLRKALGVPENNVRTYIEAEIRARRQVVPLRPSLYHVSCEELVIEFYVLAFWKTAW
ncbi:hypothetical protein IFM89_031935 [Coptis chinensis]|uniref:Uncharacterized protein n=1 Tax=Coptis chinensis TaxID=261450 RepID=A0A835IR15_9MAGN|nr:hypothetical protein IFM89_031935 [Coptis chinensis]